MMFFGALLACAPDPLVAAADPLAVLRQGVYELAAPELRSGEVSTLSVSGLPAGARCGFLAADLAPDEPGTDPASARPLGEGLADDDGVACLEYEVEPAARTRRVQLQAVCAVGSVLYRTRPALRDIPAPPGS